tara:strand:+ start:344 stop:559 length:216 start_codon:yes stop_codon:yes gene_type:complete
VTNSNQTSIATKIIYDTDDLSKAHLKEMLYITLSCLEPHHDVLPDLDGSSFSVKEVLDSLEEQFKEIKKYV